jgi:two-component system sensor histidine kinase AlgZ
VRLKKLLSCGWVRLLICSLLAALAVPVLETGMDAFPTWPQLWMGYWSGLTYSLAIGGILNVLAPATWKRTLKFPPLQRWAMRTFLILLGTAAGCLLAGLARLALQGRSYPYWLAFRESFGLAMVLSLLITIVFSTYERFKSELHINQLQLKEKEVEREKAMKLATEAMLSSLESRMRPHFLFNTINSISSLIQDDPARAEKMLGQMAELLRFSLESGQARLVPLAREMKIVRDYLEIEKARFEERLRFRILGDPALDELPFPPLSIQTLVENSVKYAVGASRNGADLLIRVRREGEQAVVTVEDNGPGFNGGDLPEGHGLSSLRARLESLYAGAGDLKIARSAGWTVVALTVPALEVSRT